MIHTGTVGSLPVEFMEANYGRAALLSPCDLPFARAGIIIEGDANQEMVVTGDLDLDLLRENRQKGSVTPFLDRRPDTYR